MTNFFNSPALSSGSSGAVGNFFTPHYTRPRPVKPKHHDHSVFHNLLTDVRAAAVGLPMGVWELGKATEAATQGNLKPFKKLGEGIAQTYEYTYGPLAHGNYGEFLHRVGQHPLQPILDAVSIATVPIGGLGVGIKAADVITGRAGGAITRAAMHFRPDVPGITRLTLDDVPGAPAAHMKLSPNPVVRGVQRGIRGTGNWLGNYESGNVGRIRSNLESKFGTSGDAKKLNPFDLTNRGVQERKLSFLRSEREVAAGAMWKRELVASRRMFGDNSLSAEDVANIVAPQIKQGVMFHSFWIPESKLLRGGSPLHEGFDFVHKKGNFHAYPVDKSPAAFTEWIMKYGERLVTQGKRKNAVTKYINGEKHYAVVRRRALRDFLEEGAHTHSALHALYKTPTKVWKWAILATAPRYFINNVVGNAFMTAMAANPVSTGRGIYDSMVQFYGKRAANRSLNHVERAVNDISGSNWVDKYYGAAMHGFSQDVTKDLRYSEKFHNKIAVGIAKAGTQGLYGVTHSVSDIIPRKIMVNIFIRRNPEYQDWVGILKQDGLSGKRLHAAAAENASENPAVREWVTSQVNDVLGQYHHYGKSGKVLKSIIPFYGWDRAIIRHTGTMVRDRPYQAAGMAALGTEGTKDTKKILGHIPDFLQGAIPIGGKYTTGILGMMLGAKHGDRGRVLTTQGLNPYATVPDITDVAGSLVKGDPKVGEEVGNQINPLITGSIQHLTGQSMVSGKKIDRHGGLLSDVAFQTAEGLPFVRLGQTLAHGRPLPKKDAKGHYRSPLLYRGDARQQVLGLLGLPVKEVSKSTADELYRRERGIKGPRKSSRKYKSYQYKGALTTTIKRAGRKHRRSIRSKPSLRIGSGGISIPQPKHSLKKVRF